MVPPQLQAPASIQINTPQASLSMIFFITSCTTYDLTLSSHHKRSSCSHPLAKTHVCISNNNNNNKNEPLLSHAIAQRGKSQIHQGVLVGEVSGCRVAVWLE